MSPLEIKNYRNKYDLTQAELSKMIGVSIRAVQSWEQGKRKIPQSVIKLLMNYESTLTEDQASPLPNKEKATGNQSDFNFEDVMRYLHENNKSLLKKPVFRAFIESNMYILEMEKDKKELQERTAELEALIKKTIKEKKSAKS